MAPASANRVIVGADPSPARLNAVRAAVAEAHRRSAALNVIRSHRTFPAKTVDTFCAPLGPWLAPNAIAAADEQASKTAMQTMRQALGAIPTDLEVHVVVEAGGSAATLVTEASRVNDLLVVGTNDGRRWRHPWRRSVSKRCATHAHCLVLVVPAGELSRATRRRSRWRAHLSRNPWRDFEAIARSAAPSSRSFPGQSPHR